MNWRTLIVDDEPLARERLLRMLGECAPDLKVETAVNGLEALEKMRLSPPDLIFLDVQMPGMDGFEVLRNLESRPFEVIFQTAFDQYALRAFDESACDYLLKPFDRERLQKALQRAKARLADRPLERLETALQKDGRFLQVIAVRQGDKLMQIPVSEILYFSSEDHYTLIHMHDREHITDLSLNHLEKRLDPSRFARCHRSHIVALDKIKGLKLGPRMKAMIANGMQVEVSRQKRAKIKGLLSSAP